jgi:hypothetical protein
MQRKPHFVGFPAVQARVGHPDAFALQVAVDRGDHPFDLQILAANGRVGDAILQHKEASVLGRLRNG